MSWAHLSFWLSSACRQISARPVAANTNGQNSFPATPNPATCNRISRPIPMATSAGSWPRLLSRFRCFASVTGADGSSVRIPLRVYAASPGAPGTASA